MIGRKVVALLSTSIPTGKALNALAHMGLGMGHQIPVGKMPGMDVRFAPPEVVRAFRQVAYKLYQESSPGEVVYSDFTDTMTEGEADGQLDRTKKTSEEKLTYFGVTVGANAVALSELDDILSTCSIAKNYKKFIATPEQGDFSFTLNEAAPSDSAVLPQKVSLVLHPKAFVADLLNPILYTCFDIGRKAELSKLRLLNFIDQDEGVHPNISYHPFPILLAKSAAKQVELAKEVEKMPNLNVSIFLSDSKDKEMIALCLFGEKSIVEPLTKSCSLWKKNMEAIDYVANQMLIT